MITFDQTFIPMKRIFRHITLSHFLTFTLSLSLSLPIIIGTGFTAKADYWTQKADYGGGLVTNAIGFSLANTAYIGLGIDYLANYRDDFWEYDQAANTWTQKANFTGSMRQGATAFAIGSTGYIGLGWTPGYADDFWKYEPSSNTWTQLINFGGTARDFASAFTINGKGYFTCGLDNAGPASDLWEYDAVLNSWTQKASLSTGVFAAVSYAVNNKGYVAAGFGNLNNSEYDPVANSWTLKAPFPFLLVGAAGFGIGNYGYVGTGIINLTTNTATKQFWQYNPALDLWTQKTDFGGAERTGAVGFTIGGNGYIGTGNSPSGFYQDFWEYTPDPIGISDLGFPISDFTVYPNPADDELTVTSKQFGENSEIKIIDADGRFCFQAPNTKLPAQIDVSNYPNGIYFLQLKSKDGIATGKVVVVH